ncbi:hypothetical protein LIER_18142 [Lithospermum erythrorhizon]|uniref:C2H2-type domain-containing protein n=1 Tax=Lithospermum erythrorhizon TaxID=34254 RepID=A0AAV3QD41_LITER
MAKIQDLKCPYWSSTRSVEKIDPSMKRMQSLLNGGAKLVEKEAKTEELFDGEISQSYGLTENPKKALRVVDQNFPLPQEKVCKQCGKVFQSMKALCGHMAFHSNRKLVMDNDFDTEFEAKKPRSKTKCKRYNKSSTNSSSYTLANATSSSVSEIDEKDQEEIAICLMMLSREYASCRGGVNPVVEYSGNYSVVLETKSRSNETRNAKKEGLKCNGGEVLDMNKTGEYKTDDSRMAIKTWKNESKKRTKEFLDDDNELIVESYKRVKYGSAYAEVLSTQQHKRSKYECFNCKRTFKSFQALGGHRPCHRRNNADDATDQETILKSESVGNNKGVAKEGTSKAVKQVRPKKPKGYVCPFCPRVFKSGQALGGHKRTHFLGGNAEISHQSLETKPVVHDLFDLNLPAPQEDDDNNAQFTLW